MFANFIEVGFLKLYWYVVNCAIFSLESESTKFLGKIKVVTPRKKSLPQVFDRVYRYCLYGRALR